MFVCVLIKVCGLCSWCYTFMGVIYTAVANIHFICLIHFILVTAAIATDECSGHFSLTAGQYNSIEGRDVFTWFSYLVQFIKMCMVHNRKIDPLVSFTVDHANYTTQLYNRSGLDILASVRIYTVQLLTYSVQCT